MSLNPSQTASKRLCQLKQLKFLLFHLILVRNATRNQGGEGFPHQSSPKGCPRCQDKEEREQHQIQDPLFTLLVHARRLRQGEGRKVEAIFATRSPGQGSQVEIEICPGQR